MQPKPVHDLFFTFWEHSLFSMLMPLVSRHLPCTKESLCRRTKVFTFNQKFGKVMKCSPKFQCRPVGKLSDNGHAPIQLHTTHPYGKRPSQMVSYM